MVANQALVKSINFRSTTDADATLPWLDHTVASSVLRCPRLGIVRYIHNKTTDATKREMPLECGAAMHLAFAAHRLYHLCVNQQHDLEVCQQKGLSIFGHEIWQDLEGYLLKEQMEQMCLQALYSSGYTDNPDDKQRTISNMEEALLYYLNSCNYHLWPIYSKPNFIGIEHKVDFVVTIEYMDGDNITIRYIGKADGVHMQKGNEDRIFVFENKTTSMINDAWEQQWSTTHQVTGYLIDMSLKLNLHVNDAMVVGLKIPLPKLEYQGYREIPLTRHPRQYQEFGNWLASAVDIYRRYKDNPWGAPMHTHACYDFFRACQFLPICAGSEDEVQEYRGLLQTKEWHPHHSE